jgi:hypothetical protein
MLYLECEVLKSAGLRDTDVIAVVMDHSGAKEQIQLEESFLVQRGGRYFLPVWGLTQDPSNKLAEVELPQESASGTNRILVASDKLFYQKEEVPA